MMTAPAGDAYDILGVSPIDDEEAIKRAFRLLARRVHPDVSSDPRAQEHFTRLRAAYEELCDPEARALLDLRRRSRAGSTFAEEGDDDTEREEARVNGDAFARFGSSILGRRPRPGVVTDVVDALSEAIEAFGTGGAAFLHERTGGRGDERFPSRVTGSRQVELDAVLTRAEAREGLVIPFRFHLGPRLIREDLSIPPGVKKGHALRYQVDAGAGVTMDLVVHIDIA